MSAQLPNIGQNLAAAKEVSTKLADLKKATKGIEAIFVKQMLNEMRKSVNKVHFGQQLGGDMFDGMMDQAIADQATKNGSFGVADNLYRQFSTAVLQEERARFELQTSRGKAQASAASTHKDNQ